MKKRHIAAVAGLAAGLAAGFGSAASAQTMAAAPMGQRPTVLQLSASAEVRAVPDVADIAAGVVTTATDASAAMAANSVAMEKVIAALKKSGIAERDIQTAGLSLQPQFRYEQNREPELTGFRASNRVQVTIRDAKATGRVIDALVGAGANQIDGPTFRVLAPDPLLDRARQQAVATARQRAELYAAAAGMKVKRITLISEGSAMEPPMPMPRMAMAMDAKVSAAPPVQMGESTLSVTVSMSFELEP